MFTEQQEEWLGEIMDQSLRRDLHVIDDSDGYLQNIGERLLAQLPPTSVHYHFVIVDSPAMNSFGTTGGRIYIFRKLIAFAKNEDQLAGLLGHEIGHMIVHQLAIDVSGWFRQLHITSLGDRQDVFNKWNQFRDNAAKIKVHADEEREHEAQSQLIADRVAIYAMMRAGYDPAEFAAFADQLFETKGKTGNFWTDLFGATRPESKRLRDIIHDAGKLPAQCVSPHPDVSRFVAWQQSIVEARRAVAREETPGLQKKVALQPPLRSEMQNMRFSPDGAYLLAQDESSIFVLSREPLANLFRIDAPDAYAVQFTPDSKSVIFYDPELRVQKWDIASKQPVFVRAVQRDCEASALSPTGELLACVAHDRVLEMLEVQSGKTLFTKKSLYDLTADERRYGAFVVLFGLSSSFAIYPDVLRFSTDERYFVGGHGESMWGYDLHNQQEVKLPGKLRPLIEGTFAFIAPDEIFGLDRNTPRHAVRMRFPSGEVLDQFPFPGFGSLTPVMKAPYVMIRPAGQAPIGAIDLEQKKVTLGYKTRGFAIYDKFFAGEDVDGQLKLYRLDNKSVVAQVMLPTSFLTTSKASAFSPDGRWLAVSGSKRGAVWKLEDGKQIVFSPDFSGAFFDQGGLIVQFPKLKDKPSGVDQLNPETMASTRLYELNAEDEKQGSEQNGADEESPELGQKRGAKTRFWQQGDLLLALKPADEHKSSRFTLEARDVRNNKLLWQLDPEKYLPRFYYLRQAGTITFIVSSYDKIKEAARENPNLNARLDAIHGREGKHDAYLLDVIEARSDKALGKVLVDTGDRSFTIRVAMAAGDNVFVSDSLNRTLVYSLASGQPKGTVLGRVAAVSKSGDRILVEGESGSADLYDTSTLISLAHYSFPMRLAYAEFADNDRIMVLTADQTVYQLSLPQQQKASIE